MTLLFMDGFDMQDTDSKWSVAATSVFTASTRFGVGYACCPVSASSTATTRAFTASGTVFVGFAFQAQNMSSSRSIILLNGDSGATNHITITLTTAGAIELRRGSTVVATSASSLISLGVWNYLEIQATISDTVGVITAKLNGTQVVTFSGDTKNAGTLVSVDTIQLGQTNQTVANQHLFDDLYLCNSSGSVNNTFLGDVRVQTLVPNAAGTTTQLAPTGSATNWQNVDESPISGSDYNASATVTDKDLYGLTDVLSGTTSIKAAQVNIVGQKTDAAAASFKPLVRSGGTTYTDSAVALGTNPTWIGSVKESDPATSAAWTNANINAVEVGVEVA